MLINTEKSIRELAKERGLAYETLRDRLARGIPPSKYRNKVPLETVIKADKLLKDGLSIRKVGKLLNLPKSTLHDQIKQYRSSLYEEDN